MAATATALAGETFTYVIYTGTIQQVLDAIATRRQDMPTFEVIAMCYDSQDNLSILAKYST
ncbi:unnamed protein product [marine sediment metagenome]|uniref:Uncharacterized protein n=1 Tax=marine sediment metagenome TaxID=412755 RepID=X0TQC5_9ZZZZ